MPTIHANGLWIQFEQDGTPDQPTIVLVHGFASHGVHNWVATGFAKELRAAGRRVIHMDCRGHGRSDKPHDPAAYSIDVMAADVEELLRYANARVVDLMGYSMGARISLRVLERGRARLRSVVLGGVGESVLRPFANTALATAFKAPDAASIQDPGARAFRRFAESVGNDIAALAAVQAGHAASFMPADTAALAQVKIPVLVIAGSKDVLVGSPQKLADLIPGARAVVVPDEDHLSAPASAAMKRAVLEFLASVDAGAAR